MARHAILLERFGASEALLAACALSDALYQEQLALLRAWGARP